MYEAVFSFSANETALRRFSLFRFYWLRPLGIVFRGRFLFVTIYKHESPQSSDRGLSYIAGSVIILHFGKAVAWKTYVGG